MRQQPKPMWQGSHEEVAPQYLHAMTDKHHNAAKPCGPALVLISLIVYPLLVVLLQNAPAPKPTTNLVASATWQDLCRTMVFIPRANTKQQQKTCVSELRENNYQMGAIATEHHTKSNQLSSCLFLNVSGLPLPVDALLSKHQSKAAFFKPVMHSAQHATLHAKGAMPILDATCLSSKLESLHILFIGDSIIREAYESWTRQGLGGKANFTDWRCEGSLSDVVFKFASSSLSVNNSHAQPVKIVIYAGCYIWSFFKARDAWHDACARARAMSSSFEKIRSLQPHWTIIWQGPSLVDVAIMALPPSKIETDVFCRKGAAQRAPLLVTVDEKVTRDFKIPFVNRYAIDIRYRGLQCDGLHSSPHANTGARTWGCSEFHALDDLVVQSALYAACRKDTFAFC